MNRLSSVYIENTKTFVPIYSLIRIWKNVFNILMKSMFEFDREKQSLFSHCDNM